jgi:HK97 family phage portal protein
MTLLGELLWPKREAVPMEKRDGVLSLTDYSQWTELGLTGATDSGVSVSQEKALRMSAVFACVRILAETVAMLPLIVYERLERGKRRAINHPLYTLLKDRPNEDMTSFEFRETVQGHMALWGNAYVHVEYDGGGQVRELFPLPPDNMIQIIQLAGRWRYQYLLPGEEMKWFDEAEIWHLRSLGSDGRMGYSPIALHRQAVGLGMAAEMFGARFFGNDARPGGVLEHPGSLSKQAQQNLLESFESRHGGLSRSHRVGILEEGMKYHEIGMPLEDAQFIQTRRFQIQEIARIYRIPPHMLADLERATFSNIEHQSIEFVVQTMMPWFVRWEQAIDQRLMLERDRRRYFAAFLVDGLLRGDTVSRYQAYAVGRQNGWLSANDIRELENQNPIEGGDTYFMPLNLVPVRSAERSAVRDVSADTPVSELRDGQERADRAVEGRRRLRSAYHKLFLETAGRIVRSEVNNILPKAKSVLMDRDVAELNLWLDQFYEEHRQFITRHMQPLFRSYGEAVAAEAAEEIGADELGDEELDALAQAYVDDFAAHHIGISLAMVRNQLQAAVQQGLDPLQALRELFDEWEESRPTDIADIETVRSGNAMAIGLYAAAGVIHLRWRAFGDNCPYCTRLNGRIVGIQEAFIGAGEDFQPEGAAAPLTPKNDVRHPPAHKGCDCMIQAELGSRTQERQNGRPAREKALTV